MARDRQACSASSPQKVAQGVRNLRICLRLRISCPRLAVHCRPQSPGDVTARGERCVAFSRSRLRPGHMFPPPCAGPVRGRRAASRRARPTSLPAAAGDRPTSARATSSPTWRAWTRRGARGCWSCWTSTPPGASTASQMASAGACRSAWACSSPTRRAGAHPPARQCRLRRSLQACPACTDHARLL